MPNLNFNLLALGLVGVLGIGGAVTVVNAQQNAQPRPKSSIQVPKGSEQKDKEERSLQPLARISAQQAAAAAEQQYGGKATGVELDNEDGNLVYSVEIGDQEIKIDAGDGKVLYADTESGGDEEGEG